MSPTRWLTFDDRVESKSLQSHDCAVDHHRIGVADAQDSTRVASFGVEDAGEKALAPVAVRRLRPFTQSRDLFERPAGGGPYGVHGAASAGCLREHGIGRIHVELAQVIVCASESFDVRQRETELVQSVATDDATEISLPVRVGGVRRSRKRARTEELVVRRQVRAIAANGIGHVLPAPASEETMVAAREHFRAIRQANAVRRPSGRPVVENARSRMESPSTSNDSSINDITYPDLPNGPRRSVSHE
ncbi:MAG TPA: hypothetical protein VFP15_05455, partial [Gemmatimonadaceae bacterium]|nr:hypothetical protein [Gemmatimonadaceae bacterium]